MRFPFAFRLGIRVSGPVCGGVGSEGKRDVWERTGVAGCSVIGSGASMSALDCEASSIMEASASSETFDAGMLKGTRVVAFG
jgi:hypothetical protein